MTEQSQLDSAVTILNSDSKKGCQPRLISTTMKPHQLTMLAACQDIENDNINNLDGNMSSRVGIICDLVGSGKSLSALSLIASDPMSKPKEKPSVTFDKFGLISMKQITNKKFTVYVPLNIIVVPHTIIKQWNDYIKNNTSIPFYTVENKKTLTKFTDDFCTNFLEHAGNNFANPEALFDYNILLVTSTQFNKVTSVFSSTYYLLRNNGLEDKSEYKIMFSRVMYDEADSIKLPTNDKIPANYYWFITSTITALLFPDGRRYYVNDVGDLSDHYSSQFYQRIYVNGLQNNGFLKTLFQNIRYMGEEHKKMIFLKNDPSYVSQSFSLMKPIIKEILCKSPAVVNILSGIVSHDIMDCINAGDIDSAIEKMACEKVSDRTSVIDVFTRKLESELHNKKLEHEMITKMNISAESKKTQLETLSKKIGEITGKIESISERIEREDACPICYDKINNQTVVKCCGNSFCFECLTQTFKYNLSNNKEYASVKDTCPCCRAVLTQDSIMIVTKEENICREDCAGSKEPLTKIEELENIITETFKKENRKMLIFSNYYNTFSRIADILELNNIKFKEIKGSGSSVNNLIKTYKETDEINCLLLNSTNAGAGLNLENTTDLVLYHNMSSELSIQVIGRAQRPGRKTELNVYRMVYDNEKVNLSDISPIVS